MQVVFYTFSKRVNSTARPGSGGASYSCVIKSPSSVIAPQISLVWQGSGNPSAYNYAYIADYGRYYWVRNWTYADRQWTADLQVDVLASWKTEIGASAKYVLRAFYDWDNDVIETAYPAKMPAHYDHINYPLGWAQITSGGVYIIGVIGAGNTFSTGGVGLYQADGAQAQTIINNAFNGMEATINAKPTSYTNAGEWIDWLGESLIRASGMVSDFIRSVIWFPFAFTGGAQATVNLGLVKNGSGKAQQLINPIYKDTIDFALPTPPVNGRAWLYVEPYRSYWLSFPPFGVIPLDAKDIYRATTLRCILRCDAMTGAGYLQICANSSGIVDDWTLLTERSAQIGVQIPIGGNNQNLLQTASGIVGAYQSMQSENVAGFLGSIGNAVSGVSGNARASGGSGGLAAITGTASLHWRYMDPTDEDQTELGRPLCEIKVLNTLSGFIQCRDGEISAPATAQELSEIQAYLTGGFFYE